MESLLGTNMRFTTSKQSLISEFTGTFSLVFFGCGSIILAEISSFKSEYIPFIFGCTISIFVYIFGKYSGAHFNPAVTLGFYVNKEISLIDSFFYITVQLLGAAGASYAHSLIFKNSHSFGITLLEAELFTGLIAEVFFTGLLMLTILLVTRSKNRIYGIAIGSAVTLGALFIGDLTGASLNPARSIGPMLISGNFENILFYLVIPPIGCIISAYLFRFFINK